MRHKIMVMTAATALAVMPAMAQQDIVPISEESLAERVAGLENKSDKFNVYLNMHGDFATAFNGNDFEGGKFEMTQLRLEMKGNINDWLSYRYRQRLNRGDDTGGYFDNVLKSIDIAGFGMHKDGFSAFLGKQCAAYGGIEFDLNPIEIYQYSDMVENMTNFMTGVNLAYDFTPRQQVQFQVLDGLVKNSYDTYGAYTPAKLPLLYNVNWNGNFADVYKTRWSASMMNEVKGEKMWYFALGNDFKITDKLGAYFDWMYSREGVDRKGIMTSILKPNDGRNSLSANYMSYLLHVNYRLTPHWSVFAKGMYETAGTYDTHADIAKGKYRTSLGYIGGIEYYPMQDSNLHFFLTYVGRRYDYTDLAKAHGEKDYNTNRISAGFIWQMPVF